MEDSFELDAAVRRSWAESQRSGTPTNARSPIATPLQGGDEVFQRRPSEYQLLKHHYSVSGPPERQFLDIVAQDDTSNDSPVTPMDSAGGVARRSSVTDVQWMRPLLNPRSSFSGASSNEVPIPQTSSSGSPVVPACHDDSASMKCWITILLNDACTSDILILAKSLQKHTSKYPLVVLYRGASEDSLRSLNAVDIIAIEIEDPIYDFISQCRGDSHLMMQWSKLSLFTSIAGRYGLICYIAPTCMVQDNIDELLEDPDICNEIDNEMCVLLTNKPSSDQSNHIQIMLLRPNDELAMCIREFFTVYGQVDDNKRSQIASLNDIGVMKILFNDTWGYLLANDYVKDISSAQDVSSCKILDFKGSTTLDNDHKLQNFWKEREIYLD